MERRRLPAAVRLRRSPPLRLRRPQYRLRADPQSAFANRQRRPQIRGLSRPRHPASRRTRRHHHLPVQHAVCDAPCQRSRPGAAALGGLRRRGQPVVVRSLARHPRSAGFRRRRGASDASALQGSAATPIAAQRGHRSRRVPSVAAGHDMHFVAAVLERWRGATSHRDVPNDPVFNERPAPRPASVEAPMLQP